MLVIIAITLFILPVAALISILKNNFKNNDKLIWVLVVLLLPFLGPILYNIIGRPTRVKE
ncbi:hypothetical protein FEZ18_02725 [Oceanihabitans sp. IOP_32]|uniref:PLDc N-terminal domain-containing protein n=1 Tax=Oceanihabitans sp. IOP_32 TaxID=2529032 RepID=UPI0012933CE3|nr:PLDc N-terminal domain-containing protein [Oceanihabitans sp. IOP_32]QFZ55974.1 hypothetical protein FEZ18_02725 [Oceanihabitans sp. IOP_32]